MIKVVRAKNREEAEERAGFRLNEVFQEAASLPVLFLSSGGSCLVLPDFIKVFPKKLTLGVGDERFSQDLEVSNFEKLSVTGFFQRAQDHNAYVLDTRVQAGEDLDAFSKRIDTALKAWKAEHPGGKIVITQGVGADGHTLGMMPFPKDKERFCELFEGASWVVGYDAKGKSEYPLRSTITMPFLREVDSSVVFMIGKEKKQALSRMLAKEGTLWETPSRIVHEMKNVTLFTDIPL